MKIVELKCNSCGAPITKSGRCEYCGTKYVIEEEKSLKKQKYPGSFNRQCEKYSNNEKENKKQTFLEQITNAKSTSRVWVDGERVFDIVESESIGSSYTLRERPREIKYVPLFPESLKKKWWQFWKTSN